MTWETLAPWMALAFTLALSILVPLFTQIANNRHQQKMQHEKFRHEEHQAKQQAYADFLHKVGAAITYSTGENLPEAGAALFQVYAYAPASWWNDLDKLSRHLRENEWDDAQTILQLLSRLIAEELNVFPVLESKSK